MSYVSNRFQQVADAFEREKKRLSFYAPAKPAKPARTSSEPAVKRRAGEGSDAEQWTDIVPAADAAMMARRICRAAAKARGEEPDDDAEDQDDQEIVDADEDDDNAKKAKDLAKKIIEAGRKRRGGE